MEALQVQPVDVEKKAITRALRVAVIVSVALAAALLIVLATASSNTRFFERNYEILLWVTLGVAAMLFVLATELVRRLVLRYRRGLFGTRLMARMAGAFVLMTVVPVALVFLVAVQFVGRSIESWFDVPLERALDSGLNLARASLDAQLADLLKKARQMALELGESAPSLQPAVLSRLRDQTGVQDALLVSGTGRIVSASTIRLTQLVPELPPAEALRQARLTRHFARVEGGEAGKPGEAGAAQRPLQLRVIVTVRADTQLLDDTRYLQLIQPVPGTLAENAEAVQQGYRDF